MKRFKERTCLVTGGAQGIGKAVAIAFSQQGANVFIADIDEEKTARVVDAIRSEGGSATWRRTDLCIPGDIQETVRSCEHEYGQIDVLVNNAAYQVNKE